MTVPRILDMARTKGVIIATAESCTGGMIAASLTDVPGSSIVFDRGFVTYSNDAKQDMLGVSGKTLGKYGAVSEPVAVEMANGALNNSRADLTVSVTGIAGPGGSDSKPEGRVCFAVARAGRASICETIDFGPVGRAKVRVAARDHALSLLLAALS